MLDNIAERKGPKLSFSTVHGFSSSCALAIPTSRLNNTSNVPDIILLFIKHIKPTAKKTSNFPQSSFPLNLWGNFRHGLHGFHGLRGVLFSSFRFYLSKVSFERSNFLIRPFKA